jgi:hypothetical protein
MIVLPPDTVMQLQLPCARTGIETDQDKSGEVPQGPALFLSRYLLALSPPPMDRLHFPVSPARPQQSSCFCACQPPLARGSFLGKPHIHNGAVKAFLGVVANSCPKIFEVASGPSHITSPLGVLAALCCVHLAKGFAAPVLVEPRDQTDEFRLVSLTLTAIIDVNRKHVAYVDLF